MGDMVPAVDYALDMLTPVRHVAIALEGAAPAALSIDELTRTYRHSISGDVSRVKRHNGLTTDEDARAWIIRRAVATISKWLTVEDGMVRFANGYDFDDVRWDGKRLHRPGPDIHARLRDPFDHATGAFSANVRIDLGSLDELRESMRSFGWLKEFPALVDERGVVLVGHRRLAVAKELGIEPVIKQLKLGDGDAADAERFKLAIGSNLGGRPLTPNDRKRLAQYLYEDQDWSQQRIAEALTVSQSQVQRDHSELPAKGNSRRGRPKGAKQTKNIERDREIVELRDLGVSAAEIAAQFGVVERTVHKVLRDESLRREALAEAPAPAPSPEPAEPAPTPEPDRVCPHCGQPWPHKENEQ